MLLLFSVAMVSVRFNAWQHVSQGNSCSRVNAGDDSTEKLCDDAGRQLPPGIVTWNGPLGAAVRGNFLSAGGKGLEVDVGV